MDTLSTNNKILIAALVGFVIGVGTVLVWNVSRTAAPEGVATVEEGEEMTEGEEVNGEETEVAEEGNEEGESAVATAVTPVLIGTEDRVNIENQEAGFLVRIDSVGFERAGWVAIHEDRNGELGNVLGASWFPAGDSRGTVELLRNTVPGNVYHAVLYSDNDNRAFELGVDAILVDSNQQPIQDTFETTALVQ